VEAALPSGSLITARLAAELGREVFAIPGSIHSPLAKGCHHLIKQGAKLVERVADVLEELQLVPAASGSEQSFPDVAGETNRLLTALGYEPCSLDTLIERTGLPVEQLLAQLTQLEILGQVSTLPGSRYQRID
jgi:DNA processing protein